MTRAALFDLDRTLVRKETASSFVRYEIETGEARLRDLARTLAWVAQYSLGILDAPKAAAKAALTLRGKTEARMLEKCAHWVRRDVLPLISDQARDAVEAHRTKGDELVIVTGASPYVAKPVAAELRIPHVLSSELVVRDGVFTGVFEDPLCYGAGKITRTQALAETLGFRLNEAVFYTDSITDLPLLDAVGERVCVNPDARLRRVARARGWRIVRW